MEHIIELRELTKYYGDYCAVNKVNLKIPAGICFGILGPNGAGKTTLLEMVEGISRKTSGNIYINGMDLDKEMKRIQPLINVQLQENNYFDYITIEKLLKFFLELYPKSKNTPLILLDKVGLIPNRKSIYQDLSGGQKQRFSIALALVNPEAKILFFDEPTTGLDPQNRRFIWDIITELKKNKKTIVLTTHYMEEAEQLCDKLIIMDNAKIIAQGTCDELKKQISGNEAISVKFENKETKIDINDIRKMINSQEISCLDHENNHFKIWTSSLIDILRSILDYSLKINNPVAHISVEKVSLEDVFIKITGKELRE